MSKVNYTDEMVNDLVERYDSGNGESVEELAERFNRSVKSIRGKLIAEKVYVKQEKPVKTRKAEGPTKKEMLAELDAMVEFDAFAGLQNATKDAIQNVLDMATALTESAETDEADESETEAA